MLKPINMMSWAEIDALDRDHLAYVLPVASTEQHGRHLTVGTDDHILRTSLDNLEKKLETANTFLRLPALHYGSSHEHMDFTGTVTLRVSTLIAVIEDILTAMKKHGVKYLVIVNSHGGNTPVFAAMSQEWAQRFGIRIYTVNYFASDFFAGSDPMLITDVGQDVHGGEIETSYLEYALPDAVRAEYLKPENDVLVDLKGYYNGWLSRELSPDNGLIGGASRSNPETGEKLFGYVEQKLISYFKIFDEEIGF